MKEESWRVCSELEEWSHTFRHEGVKTLRIKIENLLM